MQSKVRNHHNRSHGKRKAGKILILALVVGVVLATVAGLLVLINSNNFIEPR